VRRDNGESYEEFLKGLAKESGIATPTREDLARLDRRRKNKASNQDWLNPHDQDARITKMKDDRTHLAHKAEHAVDMQTGAVLAVTLQGLLSIKLCLRDKSSGLLKKSLKHGIELRKNEAMVRARILHRPSSRDEMASPSLNFKVSSE
jgi:hypothetical protein